MDIEDTKSSALARCFSSVRDFKVLIPAIHGPCASFKLITTIGSAKVMEKSEIANMAMPLFWEGKIVEEGEVIIHGGSDKSQGKRMGEDP
ncbi:hypothetical protein Tco_0780505 [Tanacetum coccineum]